MKNAKPRHPQIKADTRTRLASREGRIQVLGELCEETLKGVRPDSAALRDIAFRIYGWLNADGPRPELTNYLGIRAPERSNDTEQRLWAEYCRRREIDSAGTSGTD